MLEKFYPFTKNQIKIEKDANTTLTVIIINTDLNLYEMNLLVKQVHSSFAGIIKPYNTPEDGDTLYLVSTKEIQIPEKEKYNAISHLGILTSEVIKEAVLSVFE